VSLIPTNEDKAYDRGLRDAQRIDLIQIDAEVTFNSLLDASERLVSKITRLSNGKRFFCKSHAERLRAMAKSINSCLEGT
jgi:hypothetical protein